MTDLSGSHEVIDHVTIRYRACHFL